MSAELPSVEQIGRTIDQLGIVPVIAIEDPKAAIPLADALIDGGLPIAEITFRTSAAQQVIETLARERPTLLVGAGTVLSYSNLQVARTAGARFAFAPGFNPEMARAARELGMPFVPGVATPSEIEQALTLGCRVLKFFPSEDLGGVRMLSSLAGPYGHTGVKFVPTGGVSPTNLEAYLACNVVTAVGGSWLARKEDLAAGNWQAIRQRCEEAVAIVRKVRARVR
jgi:2-dehydro-3-deoxyphosphogluconate aldolase/(4S)-4-hydroxy-2-oxoglutarate aldolase